MVMNDGEKQNLEADKKQGQEDRELLTYFSVSPVKFIVMSICSFGFYEFFS